MFRPVLLFALLLAAHAAIMPKLDGKIVGGQEVNIEDYPYQVSLQYYSRHMCGASIIHQKYVITAAHCTDGASANAMSVRIGSSYHAFGGRIIRVARIHQHENYNSAIIDYDMSILELEEYIPYSASAIPVNLPYEGEVFSEGYQSVVSGWGYLSEGGTGPHKLQAVFIPIVSRSHCRAAYGGSQITDRMICAGIVDKGQKDACQGDSGGPLVFQGKLIGVVSWGYGCARPRYPGVYSNVAALRSFVRRIVQI